MAFDKRAECKKKYYQKHREEILKYKKEWREKNAELIKQKRHQYYLDNKDALREKHKEYHLANKETIHAKHKEYYAQNKEAILERQKKWDRKHIAAHRKAQRRYQAIHKVEISKKYGQASDYVRKAIKQGSLRKKFCEICGEQKVEAHHCDYNKPLDVMWLCKKHHAEWHRNNKPIYKGEQI